MSLFAIGDLHLSLGGNTDKPMDIYGGPWVGHAQALKKHWENLIGPGDTVILPGDISWAMRLADAMADLMWIAGLPGQKVILRGNHDLWWGSLTKLSQLHPSMHFLQNNCYEGDHFIVLGSRGWLCPGDSDFTEDVDRKIYEREIIRLNLSMSEALEVQNNSLRDGVQKTLIGAMHFPPTNEKKQKSGFTECFTRYGVSKVVYGHLHGEIAYKNGPQGTYDGVEYRLCSLDKLNGIPELVLE
jgi:uncharacterized protein